MSESSEDERETQSAVLEGKREKRKRDIIPENEDDKLEIDVNLPEPPSKKAKRKEKKQSKKPVVSTANEKNKTNAGEEEDSEIDPTPASTIPTPATRSEHGIWIGNLPFSANKESIRNFLKDKGGIDENDITRVHMPTAEKGQNKGFAYVDFSSEAVLQIALALSEKLMSGRAVLIKNAKSFEGRPVKAIGEAAGNAPKKEPSKRIFVGNLSFDVTNEQIAEHFSQAGEVEDAFLATFQDSGKCKGYGWIRFKDVEAAQKAVQGYVLQDPEDDDSEDDVAGAEKPDADSGSSKRKLKPGKAQRHYINRIHGRPLRCEFAEDSQTRYKKRFGKGVERDSNGEESGDRGARVANRDDSGFNADDSGRNGTEASSKKRQDRSKTKDERQEMRRKRHDARTIAPGKALAGAQRATGAIVAAAGKKTTFD